MILNIIIQILITIIGCVITYNLAKRKDKKERLDLYKNAIAKHISYNNSTIETYCLNLYIANEKDFWISMKNDNIENVLEFINYLISIDTSQHKWAEDIKNKYFTNKGLN